MLNFATIKNIFQNLSFSFLRLFAVIQMHDIHVHVLVDCPDIDCFCHAEVKGKQFGRSRTLIVQRRQHLAQCHEANLGTE